MEIEPDTCYRALLARDSRFDGLFFVAVRTTGVYCRPICTARTPRRDHCEFFASAALAEGKGFRPCLRCRPELAPGHSTVDAARTLARVAAARIDAGELQNGDGLEGLARALKISSRQLRRAVRAEFGVSPIELAQTRRLLLAKQLLAETRLPIVQVAYASGFESARRFNALFRSHYGLTPSRMRRAAGGAAQADSLRLLLAYRPPFSWDSMLRFLAARAIRGVERVEGDAYLRTARIGPCLGWLKAQPARGRDALSVRLSTSLTPVLAKVLARLRALFDLNARPDVIADHLRRDPRLKPSVGRNPGLRVAGAFDGFETTLRGVIGQRVSVRAATTIAGRLAHALGEPIQTPFEGVDRLAPSAETIARTAPARLAALGVPVARATALRDLARAVERGEIELAPGVDPLETMRLLERIKGIGPWTAQYVAMRVLQWPDAFPSGDLVLQRAAGAESASRLERTAEPWRPWRAYAAVHLWETIRDAKETRNS